MGKIGHNWTHLVNFGHNWQILVKFGQILLILVKLSYINIYRILEQYLQMTQYFQSGIHSSKRLPFKFYLNKCLTFKFKFIIHTVLLRQKFIGCRCSLNLRLHSLYNRTRFIRLITIWKSVENYTIRLQRYTD